MRKSVIILSVVCVMAIPAKPSPAVADNAQEPITLGDIIQAGTQWAEENLSEEALEQIRSLGENDWQAFWKNVQNTIESGSLEDYAWLKPQLEIALDYIEHVPNAEEYADWLRQRLDYFEVAEDVVTRFPPDKPLPKPPVKQPLPPPKTTRELIVPPAPVVIPPPAEAIRPKVAPQTVARRNNAMHSSAVWQAKFARRPMPAGAADLIPRLKRVFQTEGVPQELVWLAEVESTLNPRARSPAGAVGLFQFMPATAQEYGLRTSPLDERRHPEMSARAAARYLKNLYRQSGSWPLALASYNCGAGRVRRIMKARNAHTFDEIADYLPLETRMYVPKVDAIIRLREGRNAGTLPPPAGMT